MNDTLAILNELSHGLAPLLFVLRIVYAIDPRRFMTVNALLCVVLNAGLARLRLLMEIDVVQENVN